VCFPAFLHQAIHRQLAIAGHGADFPPHTFTWANEQGQDKIGGIEHRFPNEAAKGFAASQTAHSMSGKGHGNSLLNDA
jgi:hypothetical protein